MCVLLLFALTFFFFLRTTMVFTKISDPLYFSYFLKHLLALFFFLFECFL